MNLANAWTALAEALATDEYVPEVIDTPSFVIEPGDPYLAYADFGDFIATGTVYVLVDANDTDAMHRDLNAGLMEAIEAIEGTDDTPDSAGWSVQRIAKPGVYTTTDWQAYGVAITVAARVSRA